jgi:2'-5' RNA ligase
MSRLLAYWLLPAEQPSAEFTRWIQRLGRRWNAPLFAPHVTLYACTVEQEPEPMDLLLTMQEAVAGIAPFALEITGVSSSDRYTECVFAEFRHSDAAAELSRRLQERSAPDQTYELQPHLSLIYANLSSEQRENIARNVSLPFEMVMFDRLRAITGPAETKSGQDVQRWQLLAEVPLI